MDQFVGTLGTPRPKPLPPPPPTPPPRVNRPILDGLSWLWRTWQETSPAQRPQRQRQPTQAPRYNSYDTTLSRRPAVSINLDGTDVDLVNIFYLLHNDVGKIT